MTFLSPSFLWAMTAVAIPVIIHILNFRTPKTVYFSNVKLLENIEQESKSYNRLRELLILLFRILTIISLVIVFAHPVLLHNKTINAKCTEYQSIYIDNSFSMSVMNNETDNLTVAKSKASDILRSFPPNTKFLILDNDLYAPEKYFYQKDIASDKLSNITFSSKQQKIDFLIKNIKKIYQLNGLACKPHIFFISDLQKNIFDFEKISNDTSYTLYILPTQNPDAVNLYIDSVWFDTPYHISGNTDSLNVLVKNSSNQEVVNRQIELYINDTLKTMTSFDIKPNEKKQIKIKYTNTAKGYLACRLQISDYPVTFDNTFYFDYYIAPKIKILLVEGKQNPLIETFYKNRKYFDLKIIDKNIPVSELSNYQAVVINQVENLTTTMATYLFDYVRNGGIIIFIPAENKKINNIISQKFNLPEFKDISEQTLLIDKINLHDKIYKNSILKIDKNIRYPQSSKHWTISAETPSITPLLRFENNDLFLYYKNIGEGSIYVFTSPTDKTNTDFMLHPLCSPTMYNIPIYTKTNKKIYYTINNKGTELQINKTVAGESLKMKDIYGNNEFFPQISQGINNIRIFITGINPKSSTYYLISSKDTLGLVSFDYSNQESEMDFYTPEQLEEQIKKHKLNNWKIIKNSGETLQKNIKDLTQGRSLQKIFVILSLIFILAEILTIKLFKRK